MDKIKNTIPIVILTIMACVYLPFIESWFGGMLKWQSPIFMDQLSDYLRVLKLVLVFLGGILLYSNVEKIRKEIGNVLARNVFIFSGYILIAIQLPFLFLGVIFESSSPSQLNYIHKEKTFNDRSIYVYTADPGAMAKAYHYLYLKCPLPFNRFELKQITKMDWMYKYSFDVKGNNLIVIDRNAEGKTHLFDITNVSCD